MAIPSGTITLAQYTVTTTTLMTITFSEAVSGFTVGDISAPNCTLGSLATLDNIVFTVNMIPNAGVLDNTNVVTILAGTYVSVSTAQAGLLVTSANYVVNTSTAVLPISVLTAGTLSPTGDGVFDVMMQAVVAHLTVEYTARRITSDQYPQIYLGSLQTALTQAVSYVLQRPIVEKQTDTEVSKKLLVERQTKGFDDDAKQKLLKQALDSWSVAYSVAQDVNAIPDSIKVNPIDSIMKNAMDSLAIVKTNNPLNEI